MLVSVGTLNSVGTSCARKIWLWPHNRDSRTITLMSGEEVTCLGPPPCISQSLTHTTSRNSTTCDINTTLTLHGLTKVQSSEYFEQNRITDSRQPSSVLGHLLPPLTVPYTFPLSNAAYPPPHPRCLHSLCSIQKRQFKIKMKSQVSLSEKIC